MKEALFYEKLDNNKVKCVLCPHECYIKDESTGICKQRKNIGGTLYTLNYGKISSYGNDPIEKKPLFHFKQKTNVFSIGSTGCNFCCKFCQNYSISLENPQTIELSSNDIINNVIKYNSPGIAFTYNEPTVWYEYMYDIAVKAKEKGLYTVMVTNGFIKKDPLIDLLEVIDAFNIDLKSFNNKYYKDMCGGNINPVLETIQTVSKKRHVEITTLIVENENDKINELEELFRWLSKVDENIPIHLSRYFPMYKLKNPPTKKATLYEAAEIAKKYLNYVYLGNVF